MAGMFARSLQQQLNKDKDRDSEKHKHMYKFDDKEVVCAEIAGLCHDLGVHLFCCMIRVVIHVQLCYNTGHGPLSHMFEKVMKQVLKVCNCIC